MAKTVHIWAILGLLKFFFFNNGALPPCCYNNTSLAYFCRMQGISQIVHLGVCTAFYWRFDHRSAWTKYVYELVKASGILSCALARDNYHRKHQIFNLFHPPKTFFFNFIQNQLIEPKNLYQERKQIHNVKWRNGLNILFPHSRVVPCLFHTIGINSSHLRKSPFNRNSFNQSIHSFDLFIHRVKYVENHTHLLKVLTTLSHSSKPPSSNMSYIRMDGFR